MKAFATQVAEQDIDYSTLDKRDIGKWAVIVQGCWHFAKDLESAEKLADDLNAGK